MHQHLQALGRIADESQTEDQAWILAGSGFELP